MTEPKKYWYKFTSYYCPACARSNDYKERRYDKRPEGYHERHEIIESYDWCDAL